MFTKRLIDKIDAIWPSWKNDERIAQLGRLCSKYTDADLEPIIDGMADDEEVKYFDARVLLNRIRQAKARLHVAAQEEMTPRQFEADVHRRQWIKWAAANPPKAGQADWPDYASMNDDGILALAEQAYRTEARRVYGYVPGHYDWFRQQWAERDPTVERMPVVPVDPQFKAPWAEVAKELSNAE